jgi:predicted adenylyl cyclase CyaB
MSERNVEIKARIDDLDNTRKAVRELVSGAAPQITMQTDTYFKYDRGRMKLRETRGSSPVCELIVYERPDTPHPCISRYDIFPVNDSEAMICDLSQSLGVVSVVRKVRELYFYRNVRIHLDQVDGLGSFLELEAVVPAGQFPQAGEELVNELLSVLRIDSARLVEGSYSDMVEQLNLPRLRPV